MRIAVINQHASDALGGSEIQCDIIATYLTQFGHQVTYVAVNGEKAVYDCPYAVIPVPRLNPFRLHHILRGLAPDVVYWRYDKNQLFVSALVTKLVRSKFVFSMSHISNSRVWVSLSQKIFAKPGWFKGIRLRDVLRDLAHLSPLRSAIEFTAIPLFVDGVVSPNGDFLADMPVRNKITIHNSMPVEAIRFDWPRPYVAWIANLKRSKNPEKYHELAEALQDTGVDFLMVGGIQQRTYDYLAKGGERLSNFHYLGPKSPAEVNGILMNALFLVHTCDPEGFGNNFIQAWLQGTPTVTLYFDPEGIIERERIGYLSGTFSRLVEQTRYLIESEAERTKMGARALKYATGRFDADQNVRQLESFLRHVMKSEVVDSIGAAG